MDPVFKAILLSWTCDAWLPASLLAVAGLYLRGWWHLSRSVPNRFPGWRLVVFQTGLVFLFVALASPLELLAGFLLQVHMIQHVVLMMLVPPLILLGAPLLPVLRGLPRVVVKRGLGPLLAWLALQRLGHFLTQPAVCLLAFVGATLTWHVPALYELALHSEFWHGVQHTCFLATALLFWWPVIQPWPSRAHWPRWAMIPYLLLADMQNSALSAFLIFSERVLYPSYSSMPRLWGISTLEDQAAAGALMWLPGSVVFLVPVGLLISQLLNPLPAGRRAGHFRPWWPSLLGMPLLLSIAPAAHSHHTGELCVHTQVGRLAVAVFSEPTPLQVGPARISVLVQQSKTQQPVLDATVSVVLQERGSRRPPSMAAATRQASTNKLLYTALVDIPAPSRWELQIDVQSQDASAHATCRMSASLPKPGLLALWQYVLLLPVVIGLGLFLRYRRCR